MSSDKIENDPNLISILDLQREIYRHVNFFIQHVKDNAKEAKIEKIPRKETLTEFAIKTGRMFIVTAKKEEKKAEPKLVQEPGSILIHPEYK